MPHRLVAVDSLVLEVEELVVVFMDDLSSFIQVLVSLGITVLMMKSWTLSIVSIARFFTPNETI